LDESTSIFRSASLDGIFLNGVDAGRLTVSIPELDRMVSIGAPSTGGGECIFLFETSCMLVLCDSLVGIPEEARFGEAGILLGDALSRGVAEWRRDDAMLDTV
jgi:hypothetical protein